MQVKEYQNELQSTLARRTSQVEKLLVAAIQTLVYSLEAKDPYTDGHSRRVAWLAGRLGNAAGLESRELQLVQLGAMFHDIGKIGIRESVLNKPTGLTEEEYDHVKEHPEIGVRILGPLDELADTLPVVRHHHEHFNGRGYPEALTGSAIPRGARLVSIVDAFDAMTSSRPYRPALELGEAIERLQKGAASQFDPELVDLFVPIACSSESQKVLSSAEWSASRLHPLPPLEEICRVPDATHYCEGPR